MMVAWIILGAATAYLAKHRGRDPTFWFIIGMLVGIWVPLWGFGRGG